MSDSSSYGKSGSARNIAQGDKDSIIRRHAATVNGHDLAKCEGWEGPLTPKERRDGKSAWYTFWACERCARESVEPPRRWNRVVCDSPRFDHGTVVIDEQNPSAEAVVIEPDIGRADLVKVGDDQTVAEYAGNEPYDSHDRVVRVCFVDWLDTYVAGWEEWDPEELGSALREYSEQYSVELQLYAYPESRLKFPNEEDQGRDRQPLAAGRSR